MKKTEAENREESLLAISPCRESGLSQGAFCRREGIARSPFQYWCKRYDPSYEYQSKQKQSEPKPTKEGFIPLEMKVNTSAEASVLPNELEIIYKNAVRIKCSSDLPSDELQKLISLQD